MSEKFEEARKKLSAALEELEDVIKDKLHQSAFESRMISVGNDLDDAKIQLLKKESLIQNLNSEINNLQSNLEDLGKENELLNAKNKILDDKISRNKKIQLTLIEEIQKDILQISDITRSEEND